ncbi:MAG: phosphate ABC transporter permease subunit PstC [Actinobacteria bacterium]|nr:phosphate ABC transporter permease subunit PstC [Actinomycetota bacterium]
MFSAAARSAGYLVLVILAAIAVATTSKAWPAFQQEGLGYFFRDDWAPSRNSFGALSIIYGTLVVSAIGLIIAAPLSIGIALFITEVAPKRVRSLITTVMDVLASVPSVVFGLWGFLMLRPHLKDFYNQIADAVDGIPVLRSIFGPSLSGQSFMTAGIIVGLMIIPIITSIVREVFETVPKNEKHGALALGATRWEMINGVVFPHSTGGVVGAIMLGLGRAMGETIAVALVIGASPQITANLFSQGEAMPSIIARNLNEASGTYRSALIGLGVGLFVLTIFINISARLLVSRVDSRTKGAR